MLKDNETLNVTNTNSLITLAPGEFKIYGDNLAVLAVENLSIIDEVIMFPNPTNDFFKLNIKTNSIKLFDISGKKIKEFVGSFNAYKPFSIKDLGKGIYFIKIDKKNQSLKLIKK